MAGHVHIVNQTLERVRRKLLDLSRRNTLLNFRETRRTIRIIDELPDETFRILVREGKSMEFLPFVPPPETETIAESDVDLKQEDLPLYSNNKQQILLFDDRNKKNDNGATVENSIINIDDSRELPEQTETPEPKHIDNSLQTPLTSVTGWSSSSISSLAPKYLLYS